MTRGDDDSRRGSMPYRSAYNQRLGGERIERVCWILSAVALSGGGIGLLAIHVHPRNGEVSLAMYVGLLAYFVSGLASLFGGTLSVVYIFRTVRRGAQRV